MFGFLRNLFAALARMTDSANAFADTLDRANAALLAGTVEPDNALPAPVAPAAFLSAPAPLPEPETLGDAAAERAASRNGRRVKV